MAVVLKFKALRVVETYTQDKLIVLEETLKTKKKSENNERSNIQFDRTTERHPKPAWVKSQIKKLSCNHCAG